MTNSQRPPRVTAGILSYNRKNDLRRTLRNVLSLAEPSLEVLVVDNGSTDGTLTMLENEFLSAEHSRLRVIPLEQNEGIAARNRLFLETHTDFLLTLDDDSWPASGHDVVKMLTVMERDASIASVCATCIHPESGIAETAGIERFASGGSRETGFEVINIAAGGSLLRMEAVRQTAGYDADLFWGREENDLAFQLVQHGWKIVFYPGAVVYHAFSPTERNVYSRLELITRNTIWILWKYFPLLVAIPAVTLFAVRRALPFIVDYRRCLPVSRGIFKGIRGFVRFRAKRTVFSLRQSWQLRHWFYKMLYE